MAETEGRCEVAAATRAEPPGSLPSIFELADWRVGMATVGVEATRHCEPWNGRDPKRGKGVVRTFHSATLLLRRNVRFAGGRARGTLGAGDAIRDGRACAFDIRHA